MTLGKPVFLNLGSLTYTEAAEAFSDFVLLPEKRPEDLKAASLSSTVASHAPVAEWSGAALGPRLGGESHTAD